MQARKQQNKSCRNSNQASKDPDCSATRYNYCMHMLSTPHNALLHEAALLQLHAAQPAQ
jgi:hypothetical protein